MKSKVTALPRNDSWAEFLNTLDENDGKRGLSSPTNGVPVPGQPNDIKSPVPWSKSHTLVNLFMQRASANGSGTNLGTNMQFDTSNLPTSAPNVPITIANEEQRPSSTKRRRTNDNNIANQGNQPILIPPASSSRPSRTALPAGQTTGAVMSSYNPLAVPHSELMYHYELLTRKQLRMQNDYQTCLDQLRAHMKENAVLKSHLAREASRTKKTTGKLEEKERECASLRSENERLKRDHSSKLAERDEEVKRLKTFLKLAKSRIELEKRTLNPH